MSTTPKIEGQGDVTEVSSTQSSHTQPQTIEEAGGKANFLATFTPQDDKAIMRKVDRRFLLLIGILYMTKNVSGRPSRKCVCTVSQITDRLPQCFGGESSTGWRGKKHHDRAQHEFERVQLGAVDLLRTSAPSGHYTSNMLMMTR